MKPIHSAIPRTLYSTFSALRSPNYRLWFLGQLFGFFGMWVQVTAQGYLIYEITNSTAFLGYATFISGLPSYVLTIYGGVIADRISKRSLLIYSQFALMILAFIITGLIILKAILPWHILILAFFNGIVNSFDLPTRQAFVSELVDRDDLINAIALNSTMFNSATVIGPAVGGLIYALFGPSFCFLINGISYIGVIIILLMIKPFQPAIQRPKSSTILDLKEGLNYTIKHDLVRTLALSSAFFVFFGFSFVALIPAWAVDVLKGDVRTNGLLLSARGVGSLIGALMLAAMSHSNIRGKLWSAGSFVLPVAMLIFSLSRSLPLALISMAFIGWGLFSILNVTNTLIQTSVPDALRGRVMGIYTQIFLGMMPIGSLVLASIAEKTNAPIVVTTCAVIIFFLSILMFFWKPYLRKLD